MKQISLQLKNNPITSALLDANLKIVIPKIDTNDSNDIPSTFYGRNFESELCSD